MKRFDDYLPGETREQYVKRRKHSSFSFSFSRLFWNRGTLAAPGTQEYKRFEINPQYPGHISKIREIWDD